MNLSKSYYWVLLLPALTLFSCSGSRSMLNSGKVVPKGQVKFGKNFTFNISSSPIAQSVLGSVDLVNDLSKDDTLYPSKQLEHVNAAAISYCLDPIGYTEEIYVRFGLGKRLDLGFKKGGATSFDVMYQFLGSNKSFKEAAPEDKGGFYGSVGLQYSWQNYRFLNYPMFDKVQRLFGMEMTRKEFTLPVIFSKSFGPDERTGCFSFGVVYSHSFIKYKIVSKNIYEASNATNLPPELLAPIEDKVNFGSYGTFINVKVGKQFVFFNFSLAAYYQEYGKYKLIGGGSRSMRGVSIIPSYGMQFYIFKKEKKRPSGTQV